VLLGDGATLPGATRQTLADLQVEHVDVIGGADVVPATVVDQLHALGLDVARTSGTDRQATAVAAADAFAGSFSSAAVTLVRGDAFPDALVAAPWSGGRHAPVLLTAGRSSLGDPAIGYLLRRHAGSHPVSTVTAVGGADVVTPQVLATAVAAADGRAPDDYRARQAYARMTDAQRVGQLLMVGVDASTGATSAESTVLRNAHVGSLFLRGRSSAGVAATRAVTDRLRTLVAGATVSGVGAFVATDQEGGQVQVLSGPGFSTIPTALVQGTWTTQQLRSAAATWARQLRAAGVDLDLAPVLDVVPASVGRANQPIGRYDREFGHTPSVVSSHGTAFVAGMADGGVGTTAKHFPGLGRVDGNTDTTADVTDTVTTHHDAYLAPFAAAVKQGVPFVMVSLARYTRLDSAHVAAFSPTVITTMLRGDLGFRGVVISDSLMAKAVAAYSPATRILDFIGAGGDLALVTSTAPVAQMAQAVLDRERTSASFRSRVHDAVMHVLLAKAAAGLV
jgi:beta-N-acetylhexosaminidase